MGGEAAVTQMHFCGFTCFFAQANFQCDESQQSREESRADVAHTQSGFEKELSLRNEQSHVDNNGPDEVQMLIKCFESLGCFASVGT